MKSKNNSDVKIKLDDQEITIKVEFPDYSEEGMKKIKWEEWFNLLANYKIYYLDERGI